MPGQPWTAPDVAAVVRACETIARLTTPVASETAPPSVGATMAADESVQATARGLVDGTFTVTTAMPAMMADRRADLGRLCLAAARRPELLAGDTLSHGDIRPDNLLVTGGDVRSCTVVDWNWVGSGAPWMDLVGLLPMMAADGIDTEAILAASPLTRAADPEALDAFLSIIACYMVTSVDQPPPPGCTPALRQHQRLMAQLFTDYVARRRGW